LSQREDHLYDLPTEAEDTVATAPEAELLAPRTPGGLPTHLSLPRQVLSLSFWPFLDSMMVFAVGFVDVYLAGHLNSTAAMDAAGGAGYFIWLMGLLQGAVSVGATALIARAIGAHDHAQANRAMGQALVLAVMWGFVNMAMFIAASGPIAQFVNLAGEAGELCSAYLQILAVAAPCRALLFIGSACLRGAGDMRSPFNLMVAVNIANVIASVLLVYEWSPIGGHGLRGVAWGTSAAWMVGSVLMVGLLMRGVGPLKLQGRHMRWDGGMMRRLVKVGLPNLLENGGHWFGNLLVVKMVSELPRLVGEANVLGSHIIAIRIESVCFLPGFAVGLAAATLSGQYLGAGDPRRAKQATWLSWLYAAGFSTLLGVIFIVMPEPITRLVTDQEPYVSVVPRLLFIVGFAQIGFSSYLVLAGAMRGAGDTKTTMKLLYVTTLAVRLPLVWLLAIHFEFGLVGAWVAMSIELMVRGGVFMARFIHGGWTRVKV
jgi:putative MATE family efflux protein